MDMGDPEPSFLYNLKSLQKASQDAKNDELGIVKGLLVMDSVEKI